MSRISTGSGDAGSTGLVGGARVPKTDARVEAYGTVDEVNDCLGFASALANDAALSETLATVQEELFILGADLATPPGGESRSMRVTQAHVRRIESENDRLESALPPLRKFILPGGAPAAAALHLARSVCRRAERVAWRLKEHEDVNPHALVYLNRLSDYLFLLARDVNARVGGGDVEWAGRSAVHEEAEAEAGAVPNHAERVP